MNTFFFANSTNQKTDAKQQIAALKELLPHAKATPPKVELHKQIIASMFGLTYTNLTKHMKRDLWNECLSHIKAMLKLITEDTSFKLIETADDAEDVSSSVLLDYLNLKFNLS